MLRPWLYTVLLFECLEAYLVHHVVPASGQAALIPHGIIIHDRDQYVVNAKEIFAGHIVFIHHLAHSLLERHILGEQLVAVLWEGFGVNRVDCRFAIVSAALCLLEILVVV